MKKTKIVYRVFTGILALGLLSSSIPSIIGVQSATAFMRQLGYPPYIGAFLGVAKILGVIGILVPGYPRIKEWAYAGIAFDLIGATYSQLASGAGAQCLFMAPWFVLLILSYVYYHKMTPVKQ